MADQAPTPQDPPSPANDMASPAGGSALFDIRAKPFVVKAIFFAFVAVIAAMVSMAAQFAAMGALDSITAGFIAVFVILFLVGAILILTQKRLAYILSLVFALVLLLLFGSVIADSMAVPTGPFAALMVLFFGLIFVVIMSVLGLIGFKKGIAGQRHLASLDSKGGVLTGVFIGIVLGSIIVGLAAGPTIERLITSDKCVPGADMVCIEYGAGNMNNGKFYTPASLTVTVANGTITWVNGDTMAHTVTADDGSFDSGSIAPGAGWSYKFTKPGTFKYHCAPHPWMTGTVIVS